jgi:hypothetical protein
MLYSELGRHPLEINIKTRIIGYWNRLITGKQSKIAFCIYKYMKELPNFESKWINHIKYNYTKCNRLLLSMAIKKPYTAKHINKIVKQSLIDQHSQNWHANLQNSNKGRNFSIYKENIMLEQYLLKLNKSEAMQLLKFRTGNHFFPIETGRWNNINFEDRSCFLCNINDPPDEMHYLLKCPFFKETRNKYIKKYYTTRPNTLKFKQLLNTNNLTELSNLAKFVKILINIVKQ